MSISDSDFNDLLDSVEIPETFESKRKKLATRTAITLSVIGTLLAAIHLFLHAIQIDLLLFFTIGALVSITPCVFLDDVRASVFTLCQIIFSVLLLSIVGVSADLGLYFCLGVVLSVILIAKKESQIRKECTVFYSDE